MQKVEGSNPFSRFSRIPCTLCRSSGRCLGKPGEALDALAEVGALFEWLPLRVSGATVENAW
jgi:hypothetical protein